MAIANITRGSNFGGLLGYLLKESKGATIIGGTAAGENIATLTLEFNTIASLNRRVTRPVRHFSIGFAPSDGELSFETKERIGERVMTEMGYQNGHYVTIDHSRHDPDHDDVHDHDHIHIVACAVDLLTRQGIRGDWDRLKIQRVLREIEQDEGLTQVKSSWESARSAPTHGQKQRQKRSVRERLADLGELIEIDDAEVRASVMAEAAPISDKLQDAIAVIAQDQPTMTVLVARLQGLGIEVRPKITRNLVVQGLSYQMDGVAFRGNDLKNCSFPKLQSVRGVSYDRDRDLPALIAVARGEKLTIESEAEITPESESVEEFFIPVTVAQQRDEEECSSESYGLSM